MSKTSTYQLWEVSDEEYKLVMTSEFIDEIYDKRILHEHGYPKVKTIITKRITPTIREQS